MTLTGEQGGRNEKKLDLQKGEEIGKSGDEKGDRDDMNEKREKSWR